MSHSIDPGDFRRALGHFPTGVAVMTTLDEKGEPVGFTASSFNSVSMAPPLILWSIGKDAWSASAFRNGDGFIVHVLADDQMEHSNRFARRGGAKFLDFAWAPGHGGRPVIDNVAARFDCRKWAVHDGGDHWIVLGEVVGYAYDESRQPLVFAKGGYAVARRHPALETPEDFASAVG